MANQFNQSEINEIKENLLFCGVKGLLEIKSVNNTNVISFSNLKSAKLAVNALYVLNYKAVLHNPTTKIIEVIFN